MSYSWLSFRYFGILFQSSEITLDKVTFTMKGKGKQLFDFITPGQRPAFVTRRMHTGTVNQLSGNKTKLCRNLESKTAITWAQFEAKISCVSWNLQRVSQYCQDSSKKAGIHTTRFKHDHLIKDVLKKKREQLIESEQRLRKTGKTILQDIRDTKDKMKERMEGVIERENIWTVPNVLCVGRIAASPYLGYLILQGDFSLAIAIFAIAGVTDLLLCKQSPYLPAQQRLRFCWTRYARAEELSR